MGILGKKMLEPHFKFGRSVRLHDTESVEPLQARLFAKRRPDRGGVF
jgi:hypothetical protein